MSTMQTPMVVRGPSPLADEPWRASVGDVPEWRVVRDPPPGTATEADLLSLADHGERLCELIDGTLVENSLGTDESFVAAALVQFIRTFVQAGRLGKVSGADGFLRLSPSGRVRAPDVAFISRERIAALPFPRPPIATVTPDLAVEVFSISNTAAEMRRKRIDLFGSGTRLFWLVFPLTRTVAVYTAVETPDRVLSAADTLDGGDVLPGFAVAVALLFEDLDD